MKSQLLAIRTTHHIEESQLDQMLGRHESRTVDYVSFLVSPPCHATNFLSMKKFELASTADEAQGSTSRTVAGEKGAGSGRAAPDFSILHRPHIVKSKEEVHLTFCSGGCERVAHGKCDCGVPLCNNCRYLPNGDRSIFGDCKECSLTPQDSNEYFSNGRQV